MSGEGGRLSELTNDQLIEELRKQLGTGRITGDMLLAFLGNPERALVRSVTLAAESPARKVQRVTGSDLDFDRGKCHAIRRPTPEELMPPDRSGDDGVDLAYLSH